MIVHKARCAEYHFFGPSTKILLSSVVHILTTLRRSLYRQEFLWDSLSISLSISRKKLSSTGERYLVRSSRQEAKIYTSTIWQSSNTTSLLCPSAEVASRTSDDGSEQNPPQPRVSSDFPYFSIDIVENQ